MSTSSPTVGFGQVTNNATEPETYTPTRPHFLLFPYVAGARIQLTKRILVRVAL
jgi:hypothetical protein